MPHAARRVSPFFRFRTRIPMLPTLCTILSVKRQYDYRSILTQSAGKRNKKIGWRPAARSSRKITRKTKCKSHGLAGGRAQTGIPHICPSPAFGLTAVFPPHPSARGKGRHTPPHAAGPSLVLIISYSKSNRLAAITRRFRPAPQKLPSHFRAAFLSAAHSRA